MDFSKLRSTLDSKSSNATNVNLTELPSNILEAFIPGYGLISRFILQVFGFDIGIVVSAGLILFASVSAAHYLYTKASSLSSTYLTSSIYIDDHDDLFDPVLDWIAEQRVSKVARRIKAKTLHGSAADEDLENDESQIVDGAGLFHYGKWAAKVPPRYEPYYGTHRFWYNGRLLFFDRTKREVRGQSWNSPSEVEMIELICIGRSPQPVKDLLESIKIWSTDKEEAITVIRRPLSKEIRRFAGNWTRSNSRPCRPMETVVLDPEQKARLVEDVNEYLHPSSPKWYATRGIPYRRGYLFHGPPGTGKSSLSFALAGLFGLDVFVISLLEPTLTDSDLGHLFNNLPRRCIVLLEDIDTAGLIRDEKSDRAEEEKAGDAKKGDGKKDAKDEKISASDLAKALKEANRKGRSADDVKQGISLSGLLNAIDGVASHEGRVLIMTTNHPEKLDQALIRPGRVDMQVEFKRATRAQVEEIFVRMYWHNKHLPLPSSGLSASGKDEKAANGHVTPAVSAVDRHEANDTSTSVHSTSTNTTTRPKPPTPSIPFEELQRLAAAFADRIPEEKFTPAEIQGFLVPRKKDPRRALEEVGAWRDALLEAKEKKVKVVGVQ